MSEAAVSVRDLLVSYGSTVVFDGFELAAGKGAATCLTGENGTGKSTLLRCVAGLQAPDAGTVDVFDERPGRSVEFWRAVATTVENPSWYHGLTVREHAELIRMANGADPGDGVIDELFESLGLTEVADGAPLNLSSGQRQRLMLAAVLVRPSRLLILDEPEQRLDTTIKRTVADLLRRYVTDGGTLLMASHDPAFADEVGGDRVAL
ncbi:ATP-binding cassette domain-containing protein [Plantactinospora sp. GCM10030261]|uniref:ABC transporter ATP-binding protein n=1 Tax=Plantactinospora sp. GCM10030261 TaxID=3273420 RepID=UPI00360FF1CD